MMGSVELPDAQCARRDDEEPTIRRVQAVEQQLQEGRCMILMVPVTRISCSGHARDETIVYSLTTSIGKDLTDSHENSDVRRLQSEGKTRSTIT